MTKHYCVSARQDCLDRWHKAFPSGEVCRTVEELIDRVSPGDIVWQQLDSTSVERASQTVMAAVKRLPECSVVAMSKLPDQQEALLAFNAGAKGYCHTLSNAETFKQVAIVVSHGGLWIGQDLMRRVVNAAESMLPRDRPSAQPGAFDQLTSRERTVAIEVAKGATNKEVARKLNITERTVKAHLSSAFTKLNVRDRLQLVLVMNPAGQLMGHAA